MSTKKIVLIVSFLGSIFLSFLFFLGTNTCYKNVFCEEIQNLLSNEGLTVFLLSPIVLILSLITYKMRDDVFCAWWRFARWFAPVIIVVTLLLENAGGGGGIGISGAVSSAFDILIIGILYAILVIVSLVQIVRAYFKSK